MASLQAGRLNDAEGYFKKVLRHQPEHLAALNLLGVILTHLKKYDEAEGCVKSALKVNSNSDATFYNYGIILKALNRPIEALERFSQAISINATVAETWNNRGTVLNELKRYDEAVEDFNKAIGLQPNYSEAFCNKGKSLAGLSRYDEAFAVLDKALALKPDLAEAWLGRGNVFNVLKRQDEAYGAYDKALALKPDFAEAWLGRGNVLIELKQYEKAFSAYEKALELDPDLIGVEGARLNVKMLLCDWKNFDAERNHLIASVKDGKGNALPFPFLAISSSAKDQLQCAKLWVANHHPPSGEPIWQGERYTHDRIRVAYLSADFRQHPVSLLTVGMFKCHDKSHFNVTAISIGIDDDSEIRRRLKSTFERFIDAKTYSDEQLAKLVKELEIDILVDLAGFTDESRTNVLARRSAPVQINFLGYAGTMGADYIDYLIADSTIISSPHEKNYAEKIAYLPNSFMPHDEAGRIISNRSFERAEFGLPQTGFVFCCFNNSFKFNPDIFDCWARILNAVEGSVLWLSVTNPTAVANLRREIGARGLNPDRLVFARQLPLMGEHLARLRLADLFLDTLPYNAHTTAGDALWAGLPVLTCIGETFAGRVAASLLNAIGLPELITTTLKAYEELAIDLPMHPEKLAAIKNKLAENRLTTPLFDTKLFTKHIEAAYTAMYERYQAGLPPDHIVIPN